MRTGREIVQLLADSGRLLRRAWLPLLAWACVAWSVRQLGLYGSAALGGAVPQLSILVFVLGVVGHVACLVLMINTLEPRLPVLREVGRRQTTGDLAADGLVIPAGVFRYATPLEVLLTALGPFLAVYALWGLVEDQVRELFVVNVIRHSVLGTEQWSINMQNWQGYAVLAVVAWLVKVALGPLARRYRHRVWRGATVLADGVFVFTSFLALTRIAADGGDWLRGRSVSVEALQLWRGFVDALPEITGPFGWTLPEAVRAAAHGFWVEVVPGFAHLVMLPLMWLALAAVVFGWRDFDSSVTGTTLENASRWLFRLPEPIRRLALLATTDLREKYIPVVRAWQLLWRAGPRFLGATVVGWSVLSALQRLVETGLTRWRGPVPLADAMLTLPIIDMVQWVFGTTLLMALLGAAFDRCIAELTRTVVPDGQGPISAQPVSS